MKKACYSFMLLLISFTLLSISQLAISGSIPPAQVEFHKKICSSPYMSVVKRNQIKTYGTIRDPRPLISLGFSDVEKGQKIEVTQIDERQWKVRNMATGQEKSVEAPPDPVESFLKQFPKK